MQLTSGEVSGSHGTYAYFSPEVCRGGVYCGYAADLWALGVTLHAGTLGVLPFWAQGPKQLFDRIANQPFVLPSPSVRATSTASSAGTAATPATASTAKAASGGGGTSTNGSDGTAVSGSAAATSSGCATATRAVAAAKAGTVATGAAGATASGAAATTTGGDVATTADATTTATAVAQVDQPVLPVTSHGSANAACDIEARSSSTGVAAGIATRAPIRGVYSDEMSNDSYSGDIDARTTSDGWLSMQQRNGLQQLQEQQPDNVEVELPDWATENLECEEWCGLLSSMLAHFQDGRPTVDVLLQHPFVRERARLLRE
jgi:serine/threonine protein kinase